MLACVVFTGSFVCLTFLPKKVSLVVLSFPALLPHPLVWLPLMDVSFAPPTYLYSVATAAPSRPGCASLQPSFQVYLIWLHQADLLYHQTCLGLWLMDAGNVAFFFFFPVFRNDSETHCCGSAQPSQDIQGDLTEIIFREIEFKDWSKSFYNFITHWGLMLLYHLRYPELWVFFYYYFNSYFSRVLPYTGLVGYTNLYF